MHLCFKNLLVLPVFILSSLPSKADPYLFNQEDKKFLASLSLEQLEDVNLLEYKADLLDPVAVKLGKDLFFDKRLSGNGQVSCSSCHIPENYYTDRRPLALGMGLGVRNTPSILVSKYSPWQTWDGGKDSLWSQALSPLESSSEHGTDREKVVSIIKTHYLEPYKKIFGPIKPDAEGVNQAFANVGMVLMAWQSQLKLEKSRFDHFIDAVVENKVSTAKKIFSKQEVLGLRLFTGKGNCISCHNGPLFTNFEFHNVGVPPRDKAKVDLGRYIGVKRLSKDPFTCLSSYSGKQKKSCLEMTYLKTTGSELVGAFKTPSLRNIEKTWPYMHAGQFATLEDVLNHYNKPKPPFYDQQQHPSRPHFDIFPLRLEEEEKADIIAFLKTLTSPKPKV